MLRCIGGFEGKLLQQGFDFCYDKDLYDALAHGRTRTVRRRLSGPNEHQRQLLRFIENHDEPRAAATFHRARHEAAAVILATTVGAKLYHHGQLEGMQIKLPVHLARKPHEDADDKLRKFYIDLLAITNTWGTIASWQLCTFTRWFIPSPTVVSWHVVAETHSYVVLVNYGPKRAKGRLKLPRHITGKYGEALLTSKRRHANAGNILQGEHISLAPWEFSIIRLE